MRDRLVGPAHRVTTVAAALIALVALVWRGSGSLSAVLIAWALVVASFGVTLGVRTALAGREPWLVMGAAFTLYSAKVLVLGGVLLLLWNAAWLDALAFALATVALVVVWMTTLMFTAGRARIPVYDIDREIDHGIDDGRRDAPK